MRFLTLLRQVRTQAGMTQAQLAAAMSVPQSFVSKVESGERRLDVVEFMRWMKALGFEAAKFVALMDDAEKRHLTPKLVTRT